MSLIVKKNNQNVQKFFEFDEHKIQNQLNKIVIVHFLAKSSSEKQYRANCSINDISKNEFPHDNIHGLALFGFIELSGQQNIAIALR